MIFISERAGVLGLQILHENVPANRIFGGAEHGIKLCHILLIALSSHLVFFGFILTSKHACEDAVLKAITHWIVHYSSVQTV